MVWYENMFLWLRWLKRFECRQVQNGYGTNNLLKITKEYIHQWIICCANTQRKNTKQQFPIRNDTTCTIHDFWKNTTGLFFITNSAAPFTLINCKSWIASSLVFVHHVQKKTTCISATHKEIIINENNAKYCRKIWKWWFGRAFHRHPHNMHIACSETPHIPYTFFLWIARSLFCSRFYATNLPVHELPWNRRKLETMQKGDILAIDFAKIKIRWLFYPYFVYDEIK